MSLLLLTTPHFSSGALWAANEVQDAYTGINPQREYTETNSLFNVLRNVYRPQTSKSQAAPKSSYQKVAPPKWRYSGKTPKEKTEPQTNNHAVDGRYYKHKPPAKPEKK